MRTGGTREARPCRARRDEDQGERLQAQGDERRAHGEARGGAEAEVERRLSAAEAADAEEARTFGRDNSGEEPPKWAADKKKRAEKIRAAKAESEAEAQAAAAAKAKAQAEERRQAEGRKKPGKPRRHLKSLTKAQKNFDRSESRIMETKDGFIQGYDAQAAVDATAQVIVAYGLDAKQSDQHQRAPIADAIEANWARSRRTVGGRGLSLDAHLAAMEEREIDAYIAPGRGEHAGEGEAAAPRRCSARKDQGRRAHQRLTLKKAAARAVVGQIKQGAASSVSRRGVEKVANERGLVRLPTISEARPG